MSRTAKCVNLAPNFSLVIASDFRAFTMTVKETHSIQANLHRLGRDVWLNTRGIVTALANSYKNHFFLVLNRIFIQRPKFEATESNDPGGYSVPGGVFAPRCKRVNPRSCCILHCLKME